MRNKPYDGEDGSTGVKAIVQIGYMSVFERFKWNWDMIRAYVLAGYSERSNHTRIMRDVRKLYDRHNPHTPPQADTMEESIVLLESANETLTRQNKKLRHELRVLHLRLADANRGAERTAWENYELRRQVEVQAQAINALRAENEYLRQRIKENQP